MILLVQALAAVAAVAGAAAQAQSAPTPESFAAPFPGRYVAEVPPQGACDFPARLDFTVTANQIKGAAINQAGSFPLTGVVDGQGVAVILIGGFWGKATFAEGRFKADYANSCGPRHAEGALATTRR